MSTRRRHNWPKLFIEFDQSGLSQAEFCKQLDLNPKYFSLKLAKRKAQKNSVFTQVRVRPEIASSQGLILDVGHCKIHCPAAMTIPSIAALVKALT